MIQRDLESRGLCGIVFDCDGVMIDSAAANRKFYNMTLEAMGLPPLTKAQEEFAFMATVRQALENIVPADMHARIEDVLKNEIDYECNILPLIELMPGFRDFVEWAAARGFLLAIDTNRTEVGIRCVLDFFSLPPYFNPVISSSDVLPKPSPQGLETICRAWGTNPENILFVGDSLNDREAAQGAHALFAAFGNSGLSGDLEVSDYPAFVRMLLNVPPLHC